jgi:chromosome segregation ATPase
MPERSLLDLDEARKRLESIERDHLQFVELIGKLKEVKASLLELKGGGTKWLEDGKGWLASARDEIGKSIITISTLTKQADSALSTIRRTESEVAEGAKRRLSDAKDAQERVIGELVRRATEAEGEAKAAIGQVAADLTHKGFLWRQERETEYGDFRAKHFAALDEVTKSYDRMRVTYDALRTRVESWDAVLENTQRSLKDAERNATEQSAAIGRTVSLLETAVNHKLDELSQKMRLQEEALGGLKGEIAQSVGDIKDQLAHRFRGELATIRDTTAQKVDAAQQKIDGLERTLSFRTWFILVLVICVAGFSIFTTLKYLGVDLSGFHF